MTLPAHSYVRASTDLTTITCGVCGGIYAIAEKYRQEKQDRSGFWHCPYCETPWGYATSDIKKLKNKLAEKEREVEQERKRKEWAQQAAKVAEHSQRATKGHLTRVKKRIVHGVCPCCNRSFENLRRHMNTKHPAYLKHI